MLCLLAKGEGQGEVGCCAEQRELAGQRQREEMATLKVSGRHHGTLSVELTGQKLHSNNVIGETRYRIHSQVGNTVNG